MTKDNQMPERVCIFIDSQGDLCPVQEWDQKEKPFDDCTVYVPEHTIAAKDRALKLAEDVIRAALMFEITNNPVWKDAATAAIAKIETVRK